MRRGLLGLLLILAGLAALLFAPFQLGAVRVAGVGLAWWYGGAIAPLLAWLLTVGCLGPPADDPDRSR